MTLVLQVVFVKHLTVSTTLLLYSPWCSWWATGNMNYRNPFPASKKNVQEVNWLWYACSPFALVSEYALSLPSLLLLCLIHRLYPQWLCSVFVYTACNNSSRVRHFALVGRKAFSPTFDVLSSFWSFNISQQNCLTSRAWHMKAGSLIVGILDLKGLYASFSGPRPWVKCASSCVNVSFILQQGEPS